MPRLTYFLFIFFTIFITLRAGENKIPDFIILPDEKSLEEILEIPYEPFPCPVCKSIVHLPLPELLRKNKALRQTSWEMTSPDYDSDLCPHPIGGRVKFLANIPTCPSCGFSAYKDDFIQSQSEDIISWVYSTLKPNILYFERSLLGSSSTKLTDEAVSNFFVNQSLIPDIVRIEHAKAYYDKVSSPTIKRAKLSWLAAWSYRRALTEPVEISIISEQIQKIYNILHAHHIPLYDTQLRAHFLYQLIQPNNTQLTLAEKQVALFMLAGDYNRLGYTAWAKSYLESIITFAENKFNLISQDPKNFSTQSFSINLTKDILKEYQLNLISLAQSGLEKISLEQQHLQTASNLLLQSLLDPGDNFSYNESVDFIYLNGDFYRRTGDLSLALLWLKAADRLNKNPKSLATLSKQQQNLLNYYVSTEKLNLTIPPQEAQEDLKSIMQRLVSQQHSLYRNNQTYDQAE